jgi:hypothetical protein
MNTKTIYIYIYILSFFVWTRYSVSILAQGCLHIVLESGRWAAHHLPLQRKQVDLHRHPSGVCHQQQRRESALHLHPASGRPHQRQRREAARHLLLNEISDLRHQQQRRSLDLDLAHAHAHHLLGVVVRGEAGTALDTDEAEVHAETAAVKSTTLAVLV